ncbi:hypothetical protein J2S74_000153 [Evansella vedderi]|uniref:Uncharacterized protein n=1 Tax=Evansella vedderi TaxID=38282 RepID=A0ABT9ZNH5_9BACI|nr:hypothetical protein [Evansella vedderi]
MNATNTEVVLPEELPEDVNEFLEMLYDLVVKN